MAGRTFPRNFVMSCIEPRQKITETLGPWYNHSGYGVYAVVFAGPKTRLSAFFNLDDEEMATTASSGVIEDFEKTHLNAECTSNNGNIWVNVVFFA